MITKINLERNPVWRTTRVSILLEFDVPDKILRHIDEGLLSPVFKQRLDSAVEKFMEYMPREGYEDENKSRATAIGTCAASCCEDTLFIPRRRGNESTGQATYGEEDPRIIGSS